VAGERHRGQQRAQLPSGWGVLPGA
jgi:hypothetical protein